MRFSKLAAFALLSIPFQQRAAVAADQVSAQTDAYQNSVEQERLRAQTARVRKELLAVLDEFKTYSAAAAEVAQVKAALDSLETLGDKEMLAVVNVLRSASLTNATGEAKDKLLAASHDQKAIQGVLRQLADQLAQEKDETAMRKRLLGLLLRQMTHQHQVQNLVDGIIPSWEVERTTKLAIDEQGAIKEEVTQVFATLTKLAQSSPSATQQAYAAALHAGENAQVAAQADAVMADAAAKNLPKAVAGQGIVISGLEAMLLAFDSTAPTSERILTMVGEMKDLAARQNRLAANSEGVYFMAQHEIKNPQQRLDDETAAFSQEVAQLSAPAGNELNNARQAMQTIDRAFAAHKNYMEKEEKRWEIIGLEKDSSRSFTQTAVLLQKQADALASAGGSQGSSPMSGQDRTRQQIEEASEMIMKAQDHMQAGIRIMQQNGSADVVKKSIGDARSELADAQSKVAALGEAVSKEAGADLKSSDSQAGDAQSKAGTSADQMRNSWTLGGAKEDAGKALAKLQEAANRIAAEQANGQGQPSGVNGPTGTAMGGPGTPGNSNTTYSALATFSTKDRAALAVLEHETTSPEYSTMVEQYRKNLANGELPSQ